MRKITGKQQIILDFISHFVIENGYPPAYREIGKAMNISSSSTIQNHLNALRKKGYVTWEEGCPRTLRILDKKETA